MSLVFGVVVDSYLLFYAFLDTERKSFKAYIYIFLDLLMSLHSNLEIPTCRGNGAVWFWTWSFKGLKTSPFVLQDSPYCKKAGERSHLKGEAPRGGDPSFLGPSS